jgi:general secretion pathway protein F
MALFHYRAVDSAGKVVEGSLEAEGERRVVAQLHSMGLVPLRVAVPGETAGASAPHFLARFSRRAASDETLLHFTRELSALVNAGLPLDRSLAVVTKLAGDGVFRATLQSLVESVRAGKSLSAALGEHPAVFPKLYVNMIRAGETGGMLEGTLGYLVDYLERSVELRQELKSALTYPALLAVVAALSLCVLFIYVVPKFALLFKGVEDSLPWMTRALINLGSSVTRFGWLLLLLLIAGVAGVILYARTPDGRLAWDRFRLRSRLLGDLSRKLEVARLARTLGALLRGGVPLLEALSTTQGIVKNQLFAAALGQVQSQVRSGRGMARSLTESGLFPEMALQMIAVGEETGKLDAMLANLADHYDQEVKRAAKRLTALIEPALVLFMGLVIGVVVVSLLTGIFSIHDLPF